MSGRSSSVLILTLLGLFSPESAQIHPDATVVPHAPVPQVSASATTFDRIGEELARLEQQIRSRIETQAPVTPSQQTAASQSSSAQEPELQRQHPGDAPTQAQNEAQLPASSKAVDSHMAEPVGSATEHLANGIEGTGHKGGRAADQHAPELVGSLSSHETPEPAVTSRARTTPVTRLGVQVDLKRLDANYVRLTPTQMSPQAKARVQALAKAHKPKASGKDGLPIDWLPRETRKALGGNGPRDVVLLAATQEFAWYAWAETNAAWIGRVDLADPTQIHAGPLSNDGTIYVPGQQILIIHSGGPMVVRDASGNTVDLISRYQ